MKVTIGIPLNEFADSHSLYIFYETERCGCKVRKVEIGNLGGNEDDATVKKRTEQTTYCY